MEIIDDYYKKIRGILTRIERVMKKNEEISRCFENIELKSYENIYSNTITIIVDMFSNKDQIQGEQRDEWKNFIKYFKNETMFYFFNWSTISKKELFNNINKYKQKDLTKIRNIARLCGSFLACILISKQFFRDFQINLVGFGLGCYVIKYCLKFLYTNNNKISFEKINNVILIGASMAIKKKEKWKKIIEETVIDKFINCYSKNDNNLQNFCSKFFYKVIPIGFESLEINNEKGKNLVINYDFKGKKNEIQFSYEFEEIAKKIFEYYKNI